MDLSDEKECKLKLLKDIKLNIQNVMIQIEKDVDEMIIQLEK
jgi:hypothetical protein